MKGKKIVAALCALAMVGASSGGLPISGWRLFDTAVVASAENLSDYTLTISPDTLTYTGKEQKISTSVRKGEAVPINAGTDYSVTGDTATSVGTHEVTVTGLGSFDGELNATYKIIEADLNGASVAVPENGFEAGYIYAYSEWKNIYCYAWGNNGGSDSNYFGSWSGTKMDKVADGLYRIKYPELKGSDTAINFIFNNGSGQQTGNLYFDRETALTNAWFVSADNKVTIKNKEAVAPAEITLTNEAYELIGSKADAEISKVTFAGVELVEGTDYNVTGCTNNTAVETGTVTIQGKGNYTGTISKTYNIIEPQPVYTITIPATVSIDGGTAEFKAENVTLPADKQINISIDGSNTENGETTFNAMNEAKNSTVKYTIKNGNTEIADGAAAVTFTENGTQTLTFTKAADSEPTYAGEHTETLTFTIGTEEAVKTINISGATIKYKDGDTWAQIAEKNDNVKVSGNYIEISGKDGNLNDESGLVSPTDVIDPNKSYYLTDE